MLFPENPVSGNPSGGIFQRAGNKPAMLHPPLFVAGEEPGVAQHGEVLQNRRKGNVERLRQLRYGCLALCQPGQDGPAGWIRQSGKGSVQRARKIVNHMVNYRQADAHCQAEKGKGSSR